MYIEYERLKELLGAPVAEFMAEVEKEASKIERFYKGLGSKAEIGLAHLLDLFPESEFAGVYRVVKDEDRFPILREKLAAIKGTKKNKTSTEIAKRKRYIKRRENRALEFYVVVDKIIRYVEMNKTGIQKILKKYDKKKQNMRGRADIRVATHAACVCKRENKRDMGVHKDTAQSNHTAEEQRESKEAGVADNRKG